MAVTVLLLDLYVHLPAVPLTSRFPILSSDPLSQGAQRRTGLRHSCSWDGVHRLQAELKGRRVHPEVSQQKDMQRVQPCA